jgi:hypothetical protein
MHGWQLYLESGEAVAPDEPTEVHLPHRRGGTEKQKLGMVALITRWVKAWQSVFSF